MGIKLKILLASLIIIGCNDIREPEVIESKLEKCKQEQVAVDFFFSELINTDSLFYVKDETGQLINLEPPTFLEDSLYTDGLFYWKKIFFLDKAVNVSKPMYDFGLLTSMPNGFLSDHEVAEANEFLNDFSAKKQIEFKELSLNIPSSVSIVENEHIRKRFIPNSLLLKVGHHLESRNKYLVEISIYNLEYNEYKSIFIYLDKKCNVLSWKMP